jgi:dUTP pyrophosphatase
MRLKKTNPNAIAPNYSTAGAACFDFFACIDAEEWPDGHVIAPGATAVIGTGISVAVPRNHALMLYSRYGEGYKYGVRLANSLSVIDTDCTWEIMVSLRNDGSKPYVVRHGDRIAQAMLIPAPRIELLEVGDLHHRD